jgi:menaquinone-dependent protoporphyrinogen oxidase
MPRILVLYGTTDGHTAKIAHAVADTLGTEGCTVVLADAAKPGRRVTPEYYDAVIVAASVHMGRFQRSVRRWVTAHATVLNAIPTAFLPVCLAILQVSPLAHMDLEGMVRRFLEATNWHPARRQFVAGATPYTRYSFIKRWVIRRIVAKG